MKWRDQWQLSFRNIFAAPVRSLLTVAGNVHRHRGDSGGVDAGHGGTESGQGQK
ncbi:MAG: hypothetical protein ACLUE8_06995 [Lachnospiraceae bacterium]